MKHIACKCGKDGCQKAVWLEDSHLLAFQDNKGHVEMIYIDACDLVELCVESRASLLALTERPVSQ